jgi:hypothetical protein
VRVPFTKFENVCLALQFIVGIIAVVLLKLTQYTWLGRRMLPVAVFFGVAMGVSRMSRLYYYNNPDKVLFARLWLLSPPRHSDFRRIWLLLFLVGLAGGQGIGSLIGTTNMAVALGGFVGLMIMVLIFGITELVLIVRDEARRMRARGEYPWRR